MLAGQLLIRGGWAMLPIYACSVAALAIFVRKLVQVRAARLDDVDWVERAVDAIGRRAYGDARAVCTTAVHPAARAVAAAIDTWQRRPDRAGAEAARVGSLEVQRLESHLGGLSFAAQVAPLLGLLGTVVGMVDLFLDLERGGGGVDVTRLSSGIWTALLTTAAGLAVAVLALAGHGWLIARADRLRLDIHDAIERTLTALPPPAGAAGASDAPETSAASGPAREAAP